jgi:archaellum component FlaC
MSGIRSLEETLKTINKELAKADVELQPLYRTQIGNILTKIGELAAKIVNIKSEVTEVKENKSDDFFYFKKAISQNISQTPEFFGNNISETKKFIS